MRESLHFTFNDTSSEDMGVVIASPNGGLFQETLLPDRNIVETSVSLNNKPYFKRVELSPLSFSLTFFIAEWKDRDNLRQIVRWLFQDYYKPFWFNNNPDRIFYAIVEGNSTLVHNGLKEGYVELTFRCDSPFSYSPVKYETTKSSVDYFIIHNDGDLKVKPKARIKKTISTGDIQIKNTTTNQLIEFKDIQLNEEIFIDFHNEEIVSSLEYLNIYRYDKHNDTWLELELEDNFLEFVGNFDVEFETEFIYLAE